MNMFNAGRMRNAGRLSFVRLSVVTASFLLFMATFPLGAQAITITNGLIFNVEYNLTTPLLDSLTATGTYSVTSFSASQATIGVQFTNTDSLYKVSAIGFNTSPIVTASFGTSGSVFDGVFNDVNFPAVSNPIEVCVFTSANCSSSANNQALGPNSSDSFILNLTGDFSQGLTLSTFGIKFAGGPEGSFEGTGKVPVPGTLLLFGVGFAVFAGWHYYRSRHQVGSVGVAA